MARLNASSLCSWSCSAPRTLIGVWLVGACSLQAARASVASNAIDSLRGMISPSLAITNPHARGCSPGAFARFLDIVVAREGDAHAAMRQRLWLGEYPQVHRPPRRAERKGVRNPLVREILALLIGQNH